MTATRRFGIACALTIAVAIFELVGGVVGHSLALLADASHVAMDAVALGIAFAARLQAVRPATPRQSFGFARIEVLAALANGAFLCAVTGVIVVSAIHRFFESGTPQGAVMLLTATIGLIVNTLVGFALVHGHDRDASHSHAHLGMNLRAALMHVVGDALGAVGVIIGAIAILLWHLPWIDPLLSLIVAGIIIIGVIAILREAIDVLLESAPAHADTDTVRAHLLTIDGVLDIHDLHVWTLAGVEHVLTAHAVLDDRRISDATAILRRIDASLRERYNITHVTMQCETESCSRDPQIICTQRDAP